MKFSWICTAVLTVSTATAASAGSDVRRQTRENDALVIDKIIGGNFAAAKEFPYMAIPESDALCGATLIHSDILLTAAHCAGSFEGFNVFIGGVFFNGTDAKNTIQAVQERAHPEYNDINLENDIMLVKLASRSTQPKASWSSNSRVPLTGSTVRAIGFGVTEFIGDYDILVADTLMKVDLNVFEVDICQDITGFDSAFCAGAEGKATCFGDSGGPLLQGNTIVGITSFVTSPICAEPESPGGYTRVSLFNDFITTGICEMSNRPPASCNRGGQFPGFGVTVNTTCFSRHNIVEIKDKGLVPIDQLKIGDYVKDGDNSYSKVYSFGHIDDALEAMFIQIHVDNSHGTGTALELSLDHMVFVSGKYLRASQVKVGDILHGESRVEAISTVKRLGVFAPFTMSGKIEVSGVVCSSYVALLDGVSDGLQHGASHGMLLFHRLYCSWNPTSCLDETYTEGISDCIKSLYNFMHITRHQNAVLQTGTYTVVLPPVLLLNFMDLFAFRAIICASIGVLLYSYVIGAKQIKA